MSNLDEGDDWASLFFSGQPPEFVKTLSNNPDFRNFCPETDEWQFGRRVDTYRESKGERIQVFWLQIEGLRRYVAKVFPDYTPEQAAAQLRRFYVRESRIPAYIDRTVSEYDEFMREARAYTQIERFCPSHERIYFPHFHGVSTNLERSRFTSGYAKPRAIVLEALKAGLRSRRILSADLSCLPDSFQKTLETLPLSAFERAWYSSLLCDRLRRVASLHRIGMTHGDVRDCHFRLPEDMYDTVLYDFSRSYTFTPRLPLRVNSGRPRPLEKIAEGERKRVEYQVEQRATDRDLRYHLAVSLAERDVDEVLCQPLDLT
ncbi:hypothetical protein BJY00DRAFT_220848 [Aspergillus carlsbadensis]|nr:hypothetical protein BJY00DRAFT_220848 [Aspergillus carlsbadensis]